MVKSSRRKRARKPSRDFPLWAHPSGRWCRKIKQRFHYFGKIADDPDGQRALDLWLQQKDDLLAGRKPRTPGDARLTVAGLCNHFLTHKTTLLESGELAQRTFDRYHVACARLVKVFGKDRIVEDLRPDDFQSLRSDLAKTYGPVALGNEIQMTRSVFRYGVEAELFEKAIRFGPGFKKPSAKTLRLTRAASGPKMFSPEEIRGLLKAAGDNMRTMILLGLNGGLGNTDVGELPLTAIDLKGGWLDCPRPKTGIQRRIPLWPETLEAIKTVLEERRAPKAPDDDRLLFVGRRGQSYVGNHKGYRVTQELARVLTKAKIEGRAFYDLRRTFQTIAEGSRDLVAVQSIMGHAPAAGDMSAVYRKRIDDDRLKAVVDHVRNWLFRSK